MVNLKSHNRIFILLFIIFILISHNCIAGTLLLVTLESPPAEYLANNIPTGRNVDVSVQGLKRLGYDSKVMIVPWKRALFMVKTGEADAIIDAAYNEERAEYLFYPENEIYVETWYAFKSKNSPEITLDQDLRNAGDLVLGMPRGFVFGGIIQKAIDEKKFKSIFITNDNQHNIKMLIADRFDIIIGVNLTIFNIAKQIGVHDRLEIVKKTGTNENYMLNASKTHLAFSKKTMGPDIAYKFSKIIEEMHKDGTIKNIEAKY